MTPFLAQNGWANAKPAPLASDLSARRYTRLTQSDGATSILMETEPDAALTAFIAMTDWLRGIGLSAPDILAKDTSSGLLLLEDFGEAKLTALITDAPDQQAAFYDVAVSALLHIRSQPVIALSRPGATDLIEATHLLDDWYPGTDAAAMSDIRAHLAQLLGPLLDTPATVSLRDFHTDNVMWLPDRDGSAKLGLLDYQDAFLTHPAYDLMSLLTDARIDVPQPVFDTTLRTYADRSGETVDNLARAVAILGVQRNLRILGIFCRSALRDGKDHHLPALPRVRRHLARCLAHRGFAPVAHLLDSAVPPATTVPT